MSLNLNKVILAGRITSDPELKKTPNGISVTSFSIAVKRRIGDETDFLDVVSWRGTAEFITRFFRKGQAICVSGSLQKRQWNDKKGGKRIAVEIIADEAYFVERKWKEESGNPSTVSQTEYEPSERQDFEDMSRDEELPF